MKVLFDTNVILDLLLDRPPFSLPASSLFSKVESGLLSGLISATSVTTIHYLAAKVLGSHEAQGEIKKLLTLLEVAPVNRLVLENALKAKALDFEDAVLLESARHSGVDALVTRDVRGFKGAALPIYAPNELLGLLK